VVIDRGREGSRADELDNVRQRHAKPVGRVQNGRRAQKLEQILAPEQMDDIDVALGNLLEDTAVVPVPRLSEK
jgi:hypothetical protein